MPHVSAIERRIGEGFWNQMMPTYTVQRDSEFPALWRAYQDGVAIGTAGTHEEVTDYLDLIENSEQEFHG